MTYNDDNIPILLAVCYSYHNSIPITKCYIVIPSFLPSYTGHSAVSWTTEWGHYFHGFHDCQLWIQFHTSQQSVSCMAQRWEKSVKAGPLCWTLCRSLTCIEYRHLLDRRGIACKLPRPIHSCLLPWNINVLILMKILRII